VQVSMELWLNEVCDNIYKAESPLEVLSRVNSILKEFPLIMTLSQTTFSHIFTNTCMIPTVLNASESSFDKVQNVSKQLVLIEISVNQYWILIC